MFNKLKNNLKDNKNIYLVLFTITLAFTIIFIQDRYAADTYYMESYGLRNNAINPYLHDGRFVMTIFLYLLSYLPISMYKVKIASFIAAFISLFISEIIIYNILSKFKKNKTINIIASVMLILSLFVVELFYFTEYTAVTTFSILLITISTKFLINYFETKNKKNLIIVCIPSIITAFCYQGTISLLVIFPVLFVLKYSKNIKEFIINNIIIAFNYALPSITTLIVSKISGATRISGEVNLQESLVKILDGAKNLLVTSALLIPKYLYLIIFGILLAFLIYIMYKKKTKLYKYLYLFYIVLAVLIVPIVPYFIVNTNNIWMVPRSTIGLGLLITVPVLFYIIYIKENKKYNNIFIIITILYLIMELISYNTIAVNQIKNNGLEKYETDYIIRKINKYEEENDKKITKLVMYPDKGMVYNYPTVKMTGDMNTRNVMINWSFKPALSMYLGRNIIDGKEDKEIKEYCSNNNWNNIDDDQFKFKDDTLYICSY